MKRNIWLCIDGQKLTEFQSKYIFFSKITPSEKMILEKSWVGDYQSIRYLAENSTLAVLAGTWNQPAIHQPSTNTKRKFETIGRNAKRWNSRSSFHLDLFSSKTFSFYI